MLKTVTLSQSILTIGATLNFMKTNTTIPLSLLHMALKAKIKDMNNGNKGLLLSVIFVFKYNEPMLSFCCDAQKGRNKCSP